MRKYLGYICLSLTWAKWTNKSQRCFLNINHETQERHQKASLIWGNWWFCYNIFLQTLNIWMNFFSTMSIVAATERIIIMSSDYSLQSQASVWLKKKKGSLHSLYISNKSFSGTMYKAWANRIPKIPKTTFKSMWPIANAFQASNQKITKKKLQVLSSPWNFSLAMLCDWASSLSLGYVQVRHWICNNRSLIQMPQVQGS